MGNPAENQAPSQGIVTLLGPRIRQLRERMNFSQGDLEKATGLLRCYISRIENGHILPSLNTLEKIAKVLDVPLYQLLLAEEGPSANRSLLARWDRQELAREHSKPEVQFLLSLGRLIPHLKETDRALLLALALELARRSQEPQTKS